MPISFVWREPGKERRPIPTSPERPGAPVNAAAHHIMKMGEWRGERWGVGGVLKEAGKEMQRKESENQLIYHSPPLLTGALRVRKTDARRARGTDPEMEWQRDTY